MTIDDNAADFSPYLNLWATLVDMVDVTKVVENASLNNEMDEYFVHCVI